MPALNPDLTAGLPQLPLITDDAISTRVFTHRSLHGRANTLFQDPQDDPSPDNERLEFLGDSVLSCITATLLHESFPRLRVGPTSKARSLVISNENLAAICKYYRLQNRLRGATAQTLTLRNSPQVQADLFEAYIAGVYQTQGFDETKKWLTEVLRPYVKEAIEVVKDEHLLARSPRPQQPVDEGPLEDGEIPDKDRAMSPTSSADVGSTVDPGTLSYFNQWCQQKNRKVEWKTSDAKGTKATPLWRVEAWLDGKMYGRGLSTGKKGAKILAAREAMVNLDIITE